MWRIDKILRFFFIVITDASLLKEKASKSALIFFLLTEFFELYTLSGTLIIFLNFGNKLENEKSRIGHARARSFFYSVYFVACE